MQVPPYVDSSLKDSTLKAEPANTLQGEAANCANANFAEPSEQLLGTLTLFAASPQMLTELTDAKLNALKVAQGEVLAAVNAELQTRENARVREEVAARNEEFRCPISEAAPHLLPLSSLYEYEYDSLYSFVLAQGRALTRRVWSASQRSRSCTTLLSQLMDIRTSVKR